MQLLSREVTIVCAFVIWRQGLQVFVICASLLYQISLGLIMEDAKRAAALKAAKTSTISPPIESTQQITQITESSE